MNAVCVASILGTTIELDAVSGDILAVAGNPVVLSIVGTRLLINMREAGEKGLRQGTSCPSEATVSELDFGMVLRINTESIIDADDDSIETSHEGAV